jgi:hypothetical protein
VVSDVVIVTLQKKKISHVKYIHWLPLTTIELKELGSGNIDCRIRGKPLESFY